MRKLALLGALAALAVPVALPATGDGAGHVLVPGCGGTNKAAFKPSKIIVACGDGNLFLAKLKWSSWGTTSAKGKGTARENTCTPDCAMGKFKSYKVTVALTKPTTCSNSLMEFKKLKYTFTGTRPAGVAKTGTQSRPCTD